MSLRARVPQLGTGASAPAVAIDWFQALSTPIRRKFFDPSGVFVEVIVPQTARPAVDISTGTWTNELGGSTLYPSIDEANRDDTDYIQSATLSSSSSDTCEVKLGALTDPGTDGGHEIRYAAKIASGSGTLTVSLVQGTTVIVSWSDTLTSGFQEFSRTLSTVEASAISDYADLRLRFVASNP